ncbi:MAG: hypothetical protein HY396_00035 [Candidatus Doudnabacteria bacterium]|nr:hypothetical protein [Candidatus Doudnabacteria bacterium]
MKQSELFTKTLKEAPKDEVSVNAKLLARGGFIYKNSAGIYTMLPLGWRVIQKIADIIREEMNVIGGQEMFMPALVERRYLDATDRWDVEIGFEVRGKKEDQANFVLGWTHEEVLTAIVAKYIKSYKDLPFAAYQIQTKFRNEPRAKSGLLRGREFIMKDLYSFHATEEDFRQYYDVVRAAYYKVFERCGLQTIYTESAGGAFTASNTHEFQVPTPAGEDTIFVCQKCEYAENSEISKLREGSKCPRCGNKVEEKKSIEVGNIFPLGTKYSEAVNLTYLGKDGKKHLVVMGSYGIGVGRTMGAIVEVFHDEKGIIWPENMAPFKVHLLALGVDAYKIYEALLKAGIEVLYDDREETAGVKFADADLIGIPYRAVVSEKTQKVGKIEIKKRQEARTEFITLETLISKIKKQI